MNTTIKKRLTWTEKDPRRALANGWVQDPEFCRAFFDRCDHLAFVLSRATCDLALRAVEFATVHGDQHLINRSHGVLSHAFISCGDLFWAGKTLEQAREAALACCPVCRSDFFRREGYLLGEHYQARESLEALNRALEEGDRHLDADARARIYYCRGIAHHFLGNRGRALKDARATLTGLSLDSPRGYFLDTSAMIPIYLIGGDPRHDEYADASLRSFLERIKGRKDWNDMRIRSAWSGCHLSARLGDFRSARRRIKSACIQLRYVGLAREFVAATVDRCQLMCRSVEPRGDSPADALELITACRRHPKITDAHDEGLDEMQTVLKKKPHNAFEELVGFRRSFVAPVPGAMAERIGAK